MAVQQHGLLRSARNDDARATAAERQKAMAEADLGVMMRAAMMVMLKLGGPPLLVALAVGLLVSLLQAITQINEATLAFVPKALALAAVLALLGPAMVSTLADFTHLVFDRIVAVGGS
jgi:flagellar biosynthetic protein FliQ